MAVKSSNEKATIGGGKKVKMVKAGMELKENFPANVESGKESADEENSNDSKDPQAAEPGIVMASTSLPEESQETGEKLDHNNGFTNRKDEKLEGNDNDNHNEKNHESVAASTNEGGVISHENSKLTEKHEDLKEGGNVDAGVGSQKVNAMDKLGMERKGDLIHLALVVGGGDNFKRR